MKTRRFKCPPLYYTHQDECPMNNYSAPLPDFEAMVKGLKGNRSHEGNGTYSGAFAFTLTKSPKDSQTVSDMIKAAKKIVSQQSCPVIKYAWYLEYKGKDELGMPIHPHIHGMYETVSGGRIEKKHFKRAWPIWEETKRLGAGFRGGYHRPIKDGEAYSDYIKKDGGIGECSEAALPTPPADS